MHESSLITNLISKIEMLAKESKAGKIVSVTVRLGALSNISIDHFQEHFVHSSKGTIVQDAILEVTTSEDFSDVNAQSVIIERVEME